MRYDEVRPEYLPIEEHIRRARIERSVYLAELISGFLADTVTGVKKLSARIAEFLSHSTPRRTPASR